MEAIDKPEFRARRRYSAGAELSGEGVSFRIWAPEHERVSVVIEQAGEYSLQKEESGYFSALVSGIGAGRISALCPNFRLVDRLHSYAPS